MAIIKYINLSHGYTVTLYSATPFFCNHVYRICYRSVSTSVPTVVYSSIAQPQFYSCGWLGTSVCQRYAMPSKSVLASYEVYHLLSIGQRTDECLLHRSQLCIANSLAVVMVISNQVLFVHVSARIINRYLAISTCFLSTEMPIIPMKVGDCIKPAYLTSREKSWLFSKEWEGVPNYACRWGRETNINHGPNHNSIQNLKPHRRRSHGGSGGWCPPMLNFVHMLLNALAKL